MLSLFCFLFSSLFSTQPKKPTLDSWIAPQNSDAVEATKLEVYCIYKQYFNSELTMKIPYLSMNKFL